MTSLSDIIVIFSGGILLVSFFMVSRMRLRTMVSLFRAQSLLLAGYTSVLALILDEPAMLIPAGLIFVAKVFAVPYLIRSSSRRMNASERLSSFLRPTGLSIAALVLISGAFLVAQSLPFTTSEQGIVGTAFALIALGFLLLVTRTDMYGQTLGFLTLENGIFAFGLSLTHGMPLLVELGVVFDVMVAFLLMTALLARAQKEYRSVGTENLRELIG
ncbi:MAG: hypothetical protein AAB421_01280 [Patescibacteria group bacterium]